MNYIKMLSQTNKNTLMNGANKKLEMKPAHLYELILNLREIFDIVRLVDPVHMEVCEIAQDGTITRSEYRCYAVWNKHKRCTNCISARACAVDGRLEKFEFIDHLVYHVLSRTVWMDGHRYAIEIISQTNEDVLFEAWGSGHFVEAIEGLNKKIYIDSLTGFKNRRFYDEQHCRLDHAEAVAMLDIDNFKRINDTYGHAVGDQALRLVADAILHSVRSTDTVVRLGGDEILIVFEGMNQNFLEQRLSIIREKVESIRISEHPELRLTLSIGGYHRAESTLETDGNIIEAADRKLYQAKIKKNCVVV